MDKVNQLGKKLGRIKTESKYNNRRKHENFHLPNTGVESFNPLYKFRTDFNTTPKSSAYLHLELSNTPILCTVNPPTRHTYATGIHQTAAFNDDTPGSVTDLTYTSSEIDPPNPDFILAGGGIQVPVDGCYNVQLVSGAFGESYYATKSVSSAITKNGTAVREESQTTTGYLTTLGPPLYVFAPSSPLYAIVECHAGDIIGAAISGDNMSQKYPWVAGTFLDGFFQNWGGRNSSITVTLVAEVET